MMESKQSRKYRDREWRCKNGHILGSIQWNGNKVPYLALFRHAIDEKAENPEPVDVIGPLMGQMPVTCDVDGCGDVRLWDMSVAALSDLLGRLDRKQQDELEARLRKGLVRKENRYKNMAKIRSVSSDQ